MIPESLARLCAHIDHTDFVVDLYGIKERHCYTKKYVLTAKSCEEYIKSFGRSLIPMEYNVIDSVPGNDLFLTLPENVCRIDESDFRKYIFTRCATLEEQKYFYNISSLHYFLFNKEIKKYKDMYAMGQDRIQILKDTISNLQADIQQTEIMLAGSKQSVAKLRQSFSYRIGNKIIYPFSLIKSMFKETK